MTNEERKLKAIKKVYGEEYKACKPDGNGWTSQGRIFIPETNLFKKGVDFQTKSITKFYNKSNVLWRPKSLSGIENNRGWIRIEEDRSNLPKENIEYKMGKFLEDGSFCISHDDLGLEDFMEYILDFGLTHYQKIIKPEPPLW